VLFTIAERLQMSVVDVEAMSARQVYGWLEFWKPASAPAAAEPPPDDDAIDPRKLTPAQRRRIFPQGR
jgi:hypothetical protein